MKLPTEISENIDKKLAIIGVGLSLIFLIFAVIQNQQFIMHSSLTIFFASSIYLILRNKKFYDVTNPFRNTESGIYLLNIFFFVLLTACIILLTRDIYYGYHFFLVIVAIMSGILAIESILSNNKIYLPFILIKLFILGILVRGFVYYQFPSVLGNDPWYHMNFVAELIRGHSVPDIHPYDHLPAMHIIAGIISQITELSVKDSMFMIGILGVISSIFIFLIGRELFNEKVGLLSVLMLIVSNYHIHWGYYIIAMSLGLTLLPILLFLLLIQKRKRNVGVTVFILLLLILSIVTHTIFSTLILVVLLTFWFSLLVYVTLWNLEGFKHSLLTLVVVYFVMLLGYWMYVSGDIGHIATIKSGFKMGRPIIMSYQTESIVTTALHRFPLYIFMFFVALGSLHAFYPSKNNPANKKTQLKLPYIITTGGVIFFIFVAIFLDWGDLFPWRWLVFAIIPAAIPAAVGILFVSSSSNRKKFLSILFILVITYTGVMVTDYYSNINKNVTPWTHSSRHALTSSEIQTAQTIHRYTNTTIYTDVYYTHIFDFKLHHDAGHARWIVPGKKVKGIFLLRKEIVDNPPSTSGVLQKLNSSTVYKSFIENEQYDVIYDCVTVKAIKDKGTG
jgi:hypothetical protein